MATYTNDHHIPGEFADSLPTPGAPDTPATLSQDFDRQLNDKQHQQSSTTVPTPTPAPTRPLELRPPPPPSQRTPIMAESGSPIGIANVRPNIHTRLLSPLAKHR